MSITTKEIAEVCGVSRGTVDRALNNRPNISKKTKELIVKTAEKLGYKPDLVARSLAVGKTMTLGVVVFDLNNRFFTQMLVAIESKAREYGYFVYISSANNDPHEEIECIERLCNRKIDGLILYSVNRGAKFNNYLMRLKIPVITICNKVSEDWPFIGLDDRQTIVDAMAYLKNKGYSRIIYVTPDIVHEGKMNMYSLEQRIIGYHESFYNNENIGEPIVIELPDYQRIIKMAYGMPNHKIAILCANDLAALEVKDFLNHEGFKVPKDVGIMGFDNIDVLKYISPSLTTVNYPVEEMGKIAVEFAIKKISGENIPLEYILKTQIVEGETIC